MQEVIDQILNGNFEQESGVLEFSEAVVEITIRKGEVYEGFFEIKTLQKGFVNGYVTTTDYRMECLTTQFSGTDKGIAYRFHGEYMEEGDVVKGAFNVVSNTGEFYLPFVVTVEHFSLQSSIGPIRNLFHFANLAKSNWVEAVSMFYSEDFYRIFVGNDEQYYDCYKGLSMYLGKEQPVEEFLIQINKKQRVEFEVDENEIIFEASMGDGTYSVLEKRVDISRNGWGYTSLKVECKGDFLFTEKTTLTDDDFLGNHCKLPIFFDSNQFIKGKNFGEIILSNFYMRIVVKVVVKVGEELPLHQNYLSRKRIAAQLMLLYQSFRMRKMNTTTWLKETGRLVDRMMAMDETDMAAKLFKAQVLITEERYNEAEWLLNQVASVDNGPEIQAYYLYLNTLIRRDEEFANEVAFQVEQIYRCECSSWKVAWLLLYLCEDYNQSPSVKWQFLEEQFREGCCSPVIYIEALYLLNGSPNILRRLNEFSMQVIHFGVKQEMISQELSEHFLYLIKKEKEYSPLIFHTLEWIYEKRKDERVLQEICTMLIKGTMTGKKYFKWYDAGVKAQLRITNLYEYYMMCLDLQAENEIPKQVLMYFSYQNNLDYQHCAYLFHYVMRNRDKMPEIFENYKVRIEYFVMDQIRRERMNPKLSSLYIQFLVPEMINEDNAHSVAKLMFAHYIVLEDESIKKVYVYQPHILKPTEYALTDKETWLAVYDNDKTLIFEDNAGNLLGKSVEYTLEKLALPKGLMDRVLQFVKDSIPLDLYFLNKENSVERLGKNNLERAVSISVSEEVDTQKRHELQFKLLRFYYENDMDREMDELLALMWDEEYPESSRTAVMKYMVLRGKYDLAQGWIEKYGPYFADISTLVRLTGELINRVDWVYNEVLVASAWHVFKKHKYDGTILKYLAMHFEGLLKELRDLWKAADEFEVDRYELSAKMLVQMLYSRAFIGEELEVFKYYVSKGARPDIENAFVSRCAYDYFAEDKLIDAFIFKEIPRLYQQGENVQKVVKLSCIKYFAENKEDYSEEYDEFMEKAITELMTEKIHLNFLKDLKRFSHLTGELADKTIVEYHGKRGNKVRIQYAVLHENGETEEYTSEYMTEVCDGVYFKEFVLFFGESLQYYIMEEGKNGDNLTESGTLQKSEICYTQDNSKYDLINDMVISKTLQDYDTLDGLVEEYFRKEYYNEQLFKLR